MGPAYDVVLLLETQPAHTSDRVEVPSSVQDLPLQAILDTQILETPDPLAQTSAVGPLPVFEGGIMTIQPLLEWVSCQPSVVLLGIVIHSSDLTDIYNVVLRQAFTIQRASCVPWTATSFWYRLQIL